ncbi:MAG: hypothetical protein ACE5MI_00390 [Acidimicrobiia bacterium]
MHDHDDELIAALAGGHLSSAETEAARATVASCPRCSAELATQLSARQSLRSLDQVTLTDFERSRLHHVVDRPVARPWYVRLAPALGAAAGFVLVAGLGVTLLGSGADVAELPTVSEASADAIAEPASAAEPAPAAEGIEEPEAGLVERSPGLLGLAAPGPLDFGDLTEADLGTLLQLIALEQELEGLSESVTQLQEKLAEDATASVPECLEDAGVPPAIYVGTGTLAGEPIELFMLPDNRAVAYQQSSCEIVAQFP